MSDKPNDQLNDQLPENFIAKIIVTRLREVMSKKHTLHYKNPETLNPSLYNHYTTIKITKIDQELHDLGIAAQFGSTRIEEVTILDIEISHLDRVVLVTKPRTTLGTGPLDGTIHARFNDCDPHLLDSIVQYYQANNPPEER